MGSDLSSLANKNILLGVSGSIAAYKSCELLRLYQQHQAETRVIMTAQAQEFVTPLTMQSLSGNEVHTDLVDYASESAMGHIELARWSDCLVIAPASASLLVRLAKGDASDLLSAVFLATAAPRIIAPAMNKEMWLKATTQQNLQQLSKFKDTMLVQPGSGWQACGEIGVGRLAEPLEIVETTAKLFKSAKLAGKQVLITAGPTREAIDQARFISNYSSGKMGYALAQAATEAGAKVTLVSGPVELPAPPNCKLIKVESAQQMLAACEKLAKKTDAFIAAAAVADWRPTKQDKGKLPKDKVVDKAQTLALSPSPDILQEINKLLPANAVKVGFAAEATNIWENGKAKLKQKKLDMLCANNIGAAFATDDNEIILLFAKKKDKHLPRMAKSNASKLIIAEVIKLLAAKT